jgi:moderate conductance mechanosensitive channel
MTDIITIVKPILENFFVQLLIVIVIAYLSVIIIRVAIQRFFAKTQFLSERREKTLESMIVSMAQYAASIGVMIFALSHFVEIGKLLAGAGVIGIIVGFGAQSLIKDILSGITLLYEKQLHKGDFITVNNEYSGTVEEIGLRLLKVRQWSGKLLTIRNGEVSEILNFNMDKMRVIEKVTVSFQENPERILSVLDNACNELNTNHTHFLLKDEKSEVIEKFQVYGMTSLNAKHRGYEYTVIGLVKDHIYFTAAKTARITIAQHLYREGVQMSAENVRFLHAKPEIENEKETAYEQS